MKTRIFSSIIIAVAIMLTGCNASTTVSKEDFQFGKVKWGMDISETCKALNIKQKSLVELPKNTLQGIEAWSIEKFKIDNADCKLVLNFADGTKKSVPKGKLTSIDVFYSDKTALKNKVAEFNKNLGKYQSESSSESYGIMYRWDSPLTLAKSLTDKKISMKEYYNQTMNSDNTEINPTDDELIKKFEDIAVAGITVGISGQPNEDGYYGFWSINGFFAASVMAYNK